MSPSQVGSRGHRASANELCRVARENGCDRVEWTADSDNPIAVSFYAKLGGPPDATKIFYRLGGDAMIEMASSINTSARS